MNGEALVKGIIYAFIGVGVLATLVGFSISATLGLFGLVILALGIVIYRKASSQLEKTSARGMDRRLLSLILFTLILTGITTPVLAQEFDPNKACLNMRNKVITFEYVVIGALALIIVMLILPIVLSNIQIIGIIFGQLQNMLFPALVALILLSLLVYPLHVIFVVQKQGETEVCKIDLDKLKTDGPPLLKLLYNVIDIEKLFGIRVIYPLVVMANAVKSIIPYLGT